MEVYFDYGPFYYFMVKDDGIITEANSTICTALGYKKEELIGNKQDIVFPVATKIFHQTHLYPLLKMKGVAEEILISLLCKNKKQVSVLFNIERRITDVEAATFFFGIQINHRKEYEDRLLSQMKAAENALLHNTALKQAREELHTNMEQLDHQMNLVNKQHAELKQFNKVVTHDLQEPLRKLSMFANVLGSSTIQHAQQDTLSKLLSAAEKIRFLIFGLQQYLWINEAALILEQLDLNAIILSALKKVQNELPEANLEVMHKNLPSIMADKKQVELLFYHLLSNAARFRKPGIAATVEISAKLLQLNKFRNNSEKYMYTNFVKIVIKDAGLGFDPKYSEQVYGLFTRLHQNSGLGIGLSLCKQVIENHGGQIAIDTKLEVGSTVSLVLPVNQ
ncbi:MAG: ATP-binding protein [Ferruginibacter sp.]